MNVTQADMLDLPINQDVCFSTHKNQFKERIMKHQLQLLRKFVPLLKQFLEPDEEILLTVEACSPMSLFEQLTTGWIIYYIKRCVLIVTNKRILHFPTRSNFSSKKSIAQVRYGDIEKIKLSGFLGRILTLKYKNAKKEKFYRINSKDFKKLKTILPSYAGTGEPSALKQRHHLCPRCTTSLPKDKFFCQNCRLEFKNLRQALKLSILYPGGGYFYTRHPLMGIADALTETALLVMFIMILASLFKGTGNLPAVFPSVGILFIVLVYEKILTIYHVKHYIREYIPVEKDFMPIRRN